MIHLVCANCGTHKSPVRALLDKHFQFHTHLAPTYSSRIDQDEGFFAYNHRRPLQRSDHRGVPALEAD